VSVICAAGENLADGLVMRPEDVRQHGALVRDEGRRLANTLEQVLEFAGSDASRVPFQREPVDVTRVVHSALDACQAQAQSQGFEIECQLEPDLPRVYGDAAALGRALRNLIDNALKYSDGSRWIGVRAARENAYVRVTVTDRGLGIPKAEVGHVFEAFYRGREARARQIQGNGLGLSLVERIVRAHGGRVEVQSAPGQGSSFTLLLRIAPEPATQTSLEAHERAHPAG
jgi:signal transduction histidine kinase